MAQVTGTTWTNGIAPTSGLTMSTNVREDIEDVIFLLDPMDTWALSNLPRVGANAVYHEWMQDSLAAAAANAQIEGNDVSFTTAQPAARRGNWTQISHKTFAVSDTLEAVEKVGRSSERERLGVKLLKELKRDIETAIVGNQGSSGGAGGAQGGTATARSSAGMEAWIGNGTTTLTANEASNVVSATTNSANATSPGFASNAVAAPTDGTTGALTEGNLKMALQGAWEDGGNTDVILVGAKQKQVIDGFAGIATRFVDTAPNRQAAIVGAANMYVTSFGTHKIVLSRYVRSTVVLCLDTEYWALAFLRPFNKTPLAKTGEAEKVLIRAEWTLICRNNAASAKVVSCT
jgi:hypothetical protein